MNANQKDLYKKIDEILWNEWDPIGVNDIAPSDEYQSYVPEVFSMFNNNKTKEEIADKLYRIETDEMGLFGNRKHCLTVALKLKEEKIKTHHNTK